MNAKAMLAATVILILGVGVYAMMPTSLEGLGQYSPRLNVLSKYKAEGCGFSTMDHASSTRAYNDLKLRPAERKALNDELLALGYAYNPSRDSYSKSTGGMFPIRSFVLFQRYGIVVGAVRHKCPVQVIVLVENEDGSYNESSC